MEKMHTITLVAHFFRLWVFMLIAAALFLGDAPAPIRFHDVAAEAGVNFVLRNSPTPAKRLVETMPGGVAIFDYNSDGRPDIYFTNGAAIPTTSYSLNGISLTDNLDPVPIDPTNPPVNPPPPVTDPSLLVVVTPTTPPILPPLTT